MSREECEALAEMLRMTALDYHRTHDQRKHAGWKHVEECAANLCRMNVAALREYEASRA